VTRLAKLIFSRGVGTAEAPPAAFFFGAKARGALARNPAAQLDRP